MMPSLRWDESQMTERQKSRISEDATHGFGEGAKQWWMRNPNITLDMLEEPNHHERTRPSLRIEVQKLLTARGWIWYHTKDSRSSRRGFLDIWAARERDNRIIYLELKRTCKELTIDQQAVFDLLTRMRRGAPH